MPLFLISILLLFIGLASILFRIFHNKKGVESQTNRYIRYHKAYIKDEMQYEEYAEWCIKEGKIAMDAKGFEDIRQRNNALKELLESEN